MALAVVGTTTTMIAGSITQAWADVIPGTEGPDELVGTPGDDLIDSIGGDDDNFGGIGWPFNLTFGINVSFNPKAKHALYICANQEQNDYLAYAYRLAFMG